MLKALKLLAIVSRPEFLPANLGSLIFGIAWSLTPSNSLTWETGVLAALVFAVLTFVSAIGAQLNTLYDYEMDSRDALKKRLVQDMGLLGRNRPKTIMIVEFLLGLPFFTLLLLIRGNSVLFLLWLAGFSLAYCYSVPPIRLKARSWLAMASLFLVLSIVPVLFVFYTFTSQLNPLFLLFLTGHTLTIYGLIIPTDTRDYWGDKAMNVETMTVRLGLVRASLFGIILLGVGGILTGTAFFLQLTLANKMILSAFLLVPAIADGIVLKEYKKLYDLSKKYASSNGKSSLSQEITGLSARNPKWINLVSLATVLMSIIILVVKFLP